MPVAFPSRDYDAEELHALLCQFESTLIEKAFPTVQAYANAIDDFVHRHVVPDLEPFFRNMTQSVQLLQDPATGTIVGVHEGLRAVADHLARVSGKMQDYFLPFLQEGSFLVHGDSQLLARVLEDALAHSKNVDILILEGLPQRSGHRLMERVENSALVRSNPELKKRLLLAPDSSALRLLQRTKCNFVLFGSHAVTPHGCLVASAGSLQLATLAQECNVSVYSLAPTFKFAMSLSSMPFSSDDLVVLGSTISHHQQQQQQQQQHLHHHQMSRTASGAAAANVSAAAAAAAASAPISTGAESSSSYSPNRLSSSSPSHQQQQANSSAPTSTELGPAAVPSASFSAAPPSLHISPQLKLSSSPFLQSSQPHPSSHFLQPSSGGGMEERSNSSVGSHPMEGGANPAAAVTDCVGLLPPLAQPVPRRPASATTTSAPNSLPMTPQLRGAAPAVGSGMMMPSLSGSANYHPMGGGADPIVPMALSSLSQHQQHRRQSSPQNVLQEVYYSPTCASQLDLVGSGFITHFFTETGVVMPWSVADKISKIFLKEIRNKRMSSKAAGRAGSANQHN